MEEQINEARYGMSEAIESGQQPVVGVNIFTEEDETVEISIFKHAEDMQTERIEYIKAYKKNRNLEPIQIALDRICDLAKNKTDVNLVEPIIEAVEARATLQEICDALRQATDFSIPS